DVKRTFDELVQALAATPEQARAVLENRLYQNLSGTLAGTAEYMAVEQVYRLAAEGGYDLLVVDTPPARHAVDFLDAPRRLANLLGSRAGRSAAGRPTRACPMASPECSRRASPRATRSCARSARARRRRSPRWSTRRARRCSPRCRSSPPIRARSRAWR